MTLPVTDVRSNSNDQIAHAAKVLGRSADRIAVFKEIHRGKQRTKTASQIAEATGLVRKRVLEEAVKLAHKQIVTQTTRDGEIAYQRDNFYYAHRNEIVKLARNPKKLREFPTKYSPKGAITRLVVPKRFVHTKIITVDDIESFAKVRGRKLEASNLSIRESTFKKGVQKILGEGGQFKDWGGETSDLHTNRLRVNGSRKVVAFAFKGKGLKGLLTLARMGKNGDQVHRLFHEDAEVFLVQYGGQIASSVIQQMAVYAQSKSVSTGRTILYGTIDGQDSARLVAAYPRAFRARSN